MAVADTPALREGTLHSPDGVRLAWRSWEIERPRATFAVVHGHGEHSGRYAGFATAMAARGFSTFAVDLRGHGRSEGRRGHLESWRDWLKDAEAFVGHVEQHPAAGEVVPVGHSFGAVVVLSAVLDEVLQPRRFILSNPALRLRMRVPAWKRRFGRAAARLAPTLTLGSGLDPDGISRDAAAVGAYRNDPLVHDRISARLFAEWADATAEVQRRAVELRTPYLMILSDADPIVDHKAAIEFAAATLNAPNDVRVFAERYHEPFNDRGADEVYDAIAGWLT